MEYSIKKLQEQVEELQKSLFIVKNTLNHLVNALKETQTILQHHTWDCENLFECPDCGLIREEEMSVIDDEYFCTKCNYFTDLKPRQVAHHHGKVVAKDSNPAPLESMFSDNP